MIIPVWELRDWKKFSNIMFDAKFVNFIEINIVAHL